MKLIKGTQPAKRLSLSIFKEKMLGEIEEIKGGTASCMANSTCVVETSGDGNSTVDSCHDE